MASSSSSSSSSSSASASASASASTLSLLSSYDCLQEIIVHLSSRDIASLDTAICQHKPPLREIFLSSLKNIKIDGRQNECFLRGELEWLVLKQIGMQKLRIYASLERDILLESEFQYHHSKYCKDDA